MMMMMVIVIFSFWIKDALALRSTTLSEFGFQSL